VGAHPLPPGGNRPGEALLAFGPTLPENADHAAAIRNLSETGDLAEAAANLFAALRDLDGKAETIAVMPIPAHDLGEAINDRLQRAASELGTQTVVLPRVESQREELRAAGGFVVPEHAIDAQSLIARADLVISAGGTMNREAVALGTPVYTTFQGRLGAVDERLIAKGRLRMLTAPEELPLGRRERSAATARVRRDPRTLLDLLLTPLGRASGASAPGAPESA